MSATYSPPPSPAPMQTSSSGKVNVNLTDTIHWSWYLLGAVFPFIGAIAGIVFMAKSKIGPAIALWATCFLAALTWGGIFAVAEYDRLTGNSSSIVEEFNTTSTEDTTGIETDSAGSDLDALGDCMEQAETYEEIAAC